MSICLRRREFIGGLGGFAAWPLAARAQQPQSMRRIGYLDGLSADEAQPRITAFVEGLQQLGWTVGCNVRSLLSRTGATHDIVRW
jgi:putative ABC transport system substrate-binding protein